MKNEKWDDVHGNTTPDDRMVAFLESPTDSYAILQLREDVDDNIPLMFANYSYLQKKEMEPEIDRYEVVYHGSISMSEDVNRQLEDLYVKFNIDHPDDFRGHSMVCQSVQIPEGRWNPSRRGIEENYIFNGGAWTAPWAERSDCLRTGCQRAF